MTESLPGTTKKKHNRVALVAMLILFIGLVGFFASRAGLDKALVKQRLDDFIAQAKERGKAQGRDIEITYGELDVVGNFAAKHVVVRDTVLSVKPSVRSTPKAGEKPVIDALRITTPVIEIYPEAVDLSRLRIQAPQPIQFANADAPEMALLTITNNIPPVLTVGQKKQGEVPYTDVDFQAPTVIDLTYLREQQAKGAEEKTPSVVPVYETLTVAMAQGSGFQSSMAVDDSSLGKAALNLRDVVLTPKAAPEGVIQIKQLMVEWSNLLNEKQLNVLHASAKVGPITSPSVAVPYLPVALELDATYEGAMPKNAQAIASIQSPESLMTLKQFALTSKDASLTASGNFTATAGDVLPVGTATIVLTNAPFVLTELKKYGVINANNQALVESILARLTGTPVEQITDVTIPIERARGGSFKIGQTTFEELFAVLLKEVLQKRPEATEQPIEAPAQVTPGTPQSSNQKLVPSLPPASKPRLTPIEIPDQSVRG